MQLPTSNSLYFIRCSGYISPGVCCSARLKEWDSPVIYNNHFKVFVSCSYIYCRVNFISPQAWTDVPVFVSGWNKVIDLWSIPIYLIFSLPLTRAQEVTLRVRSFEALNLHLLTSWWLHNYFKTYGWTLREFSESNQTASYHRSLKYYVLLYKIYWFICLM